MEIDLNKALRNSLNTGIVIIGTKKSLAAIKKGEAKLIVVSSNCPKENMEKIENVPVINYPGSNIELGTACGKPFSISMLAIIEPGDSDILSRSADE